MKNVGLQTMKTLHSLVAGAWPTTSIFAGRIAFLLFFLGGAGLILLQPCAGAPFTFENTGSLNTGRFRHTATLLSNGTVLVAGGGDFASTSAELYEPPTGTWSTTGSLIHGHVGGTATLLPNGKVLIVGGYDGNFPRRYAELYDPASGTWTATGSLASPRSDHTATLLSNGNVLVVGGSAPSPLASAELYDPATGVWTANRQAHHQTL